MSCIGEFRGWFFRYFSILANETWSFSRLRNIKWENTTSTVRVHCRTALHCLTNLTVANALQKGGWLIPRLHKVFLQQAGFSKVFRVCVGFWGRHLKIKNHQIKVPLHQMGEGFSLGLPWFSSQICLRKPDEAGLSGNESSHPMWHTRVKIKCLTALEKTLESTHWSGAQDLNSQNICIRFSWTNWCFLGTMESALAPTSSVDSVPSHFISFTGYLHHLYLNAIIWDIQKYQKSSLCQCQPLQAWFLWLPISSAHSRNQASRPQDLSGNRWPWPTTNGPKSTMKRKDCGPVQKQTVKLHWFPDDIAKVWFSSNN